MHAREIALERWAVWWLEQQPWIVKVRKDGKGGWPDRQVLLGDGHHIWLEFKAANGHMTPAQKRIIPKLIAAGDVVIMAKTREDVMQAYFAHCV